VRRADLSESGGAWSGSDRQDLAWVLGLLAVFAVAAVAAATVFDHWK
jgi:hypothetical protein